MQSLEHTQALMLLKDAEASLSGPERQYYESLLLDTQIQEASDAVSPLNMGDQAEDIGIRSDALLRVINWRSVTSEFESSFRLDEWGL